jgi:toxin HigB-1
MILSFRDSRTERFANGERISKFESFRPQAERRLRVLESAIRLIDLAQLPSNRFEALGGNRKGQFSIRINQKWRICFEWREGSDGPENVEIVDYH